LVERYLPGEERSSLEGVALLRQALAPRSGDAGFQNVGRAGLALIRVRSVRIVPEGASHLPGVYLRTSTGTEFRRPPYR